MAKYLIEESTMQNIVSSIKELSGSNEAISGSDLGNTLAIAATTKVDPPSGKITLTENATNVDVSQYAAADIAVPVPVMPDDYAIGGSLADNTATGYYIKRGISMINGKAFRQHTNLETIDIPDTVTIIKETAFYYLSNLLLSKLPQQLTTLENEVFAGCSKITLDSGLPNTLTSIGQGAFRACSKINFDSLPDNMTILPNNAFAQCSSLELKKLPKNLVSIGNAAFSGCIKNMITEIPSNVTLIDKNAFYNNTSLTSIEFKGNPTTIDSMAFIYCNNLLDIYVPWAEDEVANAPWGATNATIHYNYTGGGK